MEITLLILVVLLLAGNGLLVWLLLRKTQTPKNDQGLLLLQQQLQSVNDTLDHKLSDFQKQFGDSNKDIQQAVRSQFSESQKLIQNITEKVTKVDESTKQIFNVGEQLQNLEKVLKHQKQRGNLGEASLELSLGNILPPDAYQTQYLFENGDQVDAVIHTKDGVIPVDAKFSLDNYNRLTQEEDEEKRKVVEKEFIADLKKRINETAKYIRPKEGTLPFAFMYIPAEGIYYDLLVNEVGAVKVNTRSLIDYAYSDKNVIIVSPTTFSAYLQSVLYGFRAFKIEESAKDIRKNIALLGRHIAAYDEYFKKLGNSLGTTVNHYTGAEKELKKIDKDIFRITGDSPEIEQLSLEKPKSE
jgi:DNA recombination protein RmuC